MARMADSYQRFLAIPAMFVLAFVAGFGVLLALWAADSWYVAASLAGLAATLIALAGLTVASRAVTVYGVVVQAAVVVWLLLLAGTDAAFELLVLFLAVGVAGLLALSAVLMPPRIEEVPEPHTAPAPGATSASGRNAALLAMTLVAAVSIALLGASTQQGDYAYGGLAGLTGGIGLAGAALCLFALRVRHESLAAGVAVVQAVLVLMLFFLFGHGSVYGAVHVLIAVADGVTMWAALGPGLRTPQSAAPRPRAQG